MASLNPSFATRRRLFKRLGLLAAFALGSALPVTVASAGLSDRFEVLRAQDLRVARVAYRLSIANKSSCSANAAPQSGLVLHSLDQYGPSDRQAAARSFHLGTHINVMGVVPGSPAAMAGLAADAALVAVNGRALRGGAGADRPTRASTEQARQIIAEEMKKGEIVLRVAGANGDKEVRFTGDVGCPAIVEVAPGDAVNAWADGQRVVVSAGLLLRCKTDADLALVIAHELAHNLLHHRKTLAAAGREAETARIRDTEEEADKFAATLALAAGYDLGGAVDFLSDLMTADVETVAATHPRLDRRLALLRTAIAAAKG